MNSTSTLDDKIEGTKAGILGQVHKVNQHVNDLRTEIARVSDSFKSKHKEVYKSLDHLLRYTEQSSTLCPTIPLILPYYSIISPSFGMLPNIVPQFPTNMQASTVPSIVDTHCPSMVPTKNVAPISSGNTLMKKT